LFLLLVQPCTVIDQVPANVSDDGMAKTICFRVISDWLGMRTFEIGFFPMCWLLAPSVDALMPANET